jgi:transketolase
MSSGTMSDGDDVAKLEDVARMLRRDVVTMIRESGDGHAGGSLSAADIVAALYFSVMRVDPADPRKADRDRFILSKGHACPVLYAALARRGYFSPDILSTLRTLGSPLQGHPDMNKTPGVDMTAGSLGHGIGIGSGMATASRMLGSDFRVYALLGDGELNEGLVWESAISAVRLKADRLCAIVDNNGFQGDGRIEEVSGMRDIGARFASFGWHVRDIDGHDMGQILDALAEAATVKGRPSMIVAKTVKGKGVPFMENENAWHKKVPTLAEHAAAMEALGGTR